MISEDSCSNRSFGLYNNSVISICLMASVLKECEFKPSNINLSMSLLGITVGHIQQHGELSLSTLDSRPHGPPLWLVPLPLPSTPGCFPDFLGVPVYFIRQERMFSKQVKRPVIHLSPPSPHCTYSSFQ